MASTPGAGAATLLERLGRIDARGIPGRDTAEKKTGERRNGDREAEDRQVYAEICLSGQSSARHQGEHALQQGITEGDAQGPAEKGQQEILGEKLLEDHDWGRAQGTADGHFLLPAHTPAQQ